MARKTTTLAKTIPDDRPVSSYAINKELYQHTYTDASADQINKAIRDLDIGNFDNAVILLNKMLQDSRLAAVLDSRTYNLVNNSISVVDSLPDNINKTILQSAIDRGEQEIKAWYANSLMLGVGLLQIVAKPELNQGKIDFSLINYEPYGLRYDLNEDLYFLITSYKDQNDELRKYRIDQLKNSNGCVSLIDYQKNFDVEIITDNSKWILIQQGDRGFKRGYIRSLAWDWLSKQLAQADLDNWNAKSAGPIIKLKVPVASDPANNKTFSQSVKNVEKYGVIVLPQMDDGASYDAEYMEAGTSTTASESYKSTIADTDTNYAIRILSNNLTTNVTAGSQAAATTHLEKEQNLAKSDKQFVQSVMTDQLMAYYHTVNDSNYKAEIVLNIDATQEIREKLAIVESLSKLNSATFGSYGIDFAQIIGELGISWIQQIQIKEEQKQARFDLAPTDIAKVVRVDEARASQGLPPIGDDRGNLTIDALDQIPTKSEPEATNQ